MAHHFLICPAPFQHRSKKKGQSDFQLALSVVLLDVYVSFSCFEVYNIADEIMFTFVRWLVS